MGTTRFERIAAETPIHSSLVGPHNPACIWTGTVYLDLKRPRPTDIFLRDIARGLAWSNRYNGLMRGIPTAAHSLACVELAEWDLERNNPGLLFELLMHDAAEAYVGDSVRAVKHLVPEFAELEKQIFNAIAMRYLMPAAPSPLVKHYDNLSLALEKRDLVGGGGDWPGLPDAGDRPLPAIYRRTPEELEQDFLDKARELLGELGRKPW